MPSILSLRKKEAVQEIVYPFPRIRHINNAAIRDVFSSWLKHHIKRGHTVRPIVDGVPMNEQDFFFPADFRCWAWSRRHMF